MELTKINTIWRQIARMRAGVAYNLLSHTQAPGNLSYTAVEAARNEPTTAGNKWWIVWAYWKHEHGQRVATKEEVEDIRQRCKDYTGMTVNGDELMLVDNDYLEEIKRNCLLTTVQTYNAKIFGYE